MGIAHGILLLGLGLLVTFVFFVTLMHVHELEAPREDENVTQD